MLGLASKAGSLAAVESGLGSHPRPKSFSLTVIARNEDCYSHLSASSPALRSQIVDRSSISRAVSCVRQVVVEIDRRVLRQLHRTSAQPAARKPGWY